MRAKISGSTRMISMDVAFGLTEGGRYTAGQQRPKRQEPNALKGLEINDTKFIAMKTRIIFTVA